MQRSYSPNDYEEAAAEVQAALNCGGKVRSHFLDRIPTMLREAAREQKLADARAAATEAMAFEPPPPTQPEPPEPKEAA